LSASKARVVQELENLQQQVKSNRKEM